MTSARFSLEIVRRAVAATDRYRAYQRRWRTGRKFNDEKTVALCVSYLRRNKQIELAGIELDRLLQHALGGPPS